VKERHWNSLVGSVRHGHCILMLGSEIPVSVSSTDPKAVAREDTSLAEELRRQLALELEEDNRSPRVSGIPTMAVLTGMRSPVTTRNLWA
jgi:hypothetical protein